MRKFERFFITIADFRADMRNRTNSQFVKEIIGDSVDNNRTVTVNQTIRYLEQVGKRKLANNLRVTYSLLQEHIKAHRDARTDAIDLNEFVTTYRSYVMDNRLFRRSVARSLK